MISPTVSVMYSVARVRVVVARLFQSTNKDEEQLAVGVLSIVGPEGSWSQGCGLPQTGVLSNAGLTPRQNHLHTHIHTRLLGDYGRKLKHLDETHTGTKKTYQPHRDRPLVNPGIKPRTFSPCCTHCGIIIGRIVYPV